MRRLIRASFAAAKSGAFGGGTSRGVERLAQARDNATQAFRARRDPAVVAERRRIAARRRAVSWSAAALLCAGLGARGIVTIVDGTRTVGSIGTALVLAGLLVYAGIGAVRAGIDLRERRRIVRELPAPRPRRRAVASVIRTDIARLDGYSDALRLAVGTIGVVDGRSASAQIRAMRDDTLDAADDAEVRLRGKAAQLTALVRAGGGPVAGTIDVLKSDICAGIDTYGRLVSAASEAAAASEQLAAHTGSNDGVVSMTERLSALAAGMRDLSPSATDEQQ